MGVVRIGLEGKLYYGEANSQASIEITKCRDVTIEMEANMADISSRASLGWRSKKPTLRDLAIEFELIWSDGDAVAAALRAAFTAGTAIALYAKDYESGAGVDADFYVTRFSKSEPLEEGQSISVRCEFTDENRAFAWS